MTSFLDHTHPLYDGYDQFPKLTLIWSTNSCPEVRHITYAPGHMGKRLCYANEFGWRQIVSIQTFIAAVI